MAISKTYERSARAQDPCVTWPSHAWLLQDWPMQAWAGDPAGFPFPFVGLAHATRVQSRVALCGVRTPFLGDPWPKAGAPWVSLAARCPTCALRLYSARV